MFLSERVDRCRAVLKTEGASALALEAGVDLEYLTGVRWRRSERPLLFVLPVSGEPFWVGPHFEEGTLRESRIGTGELRLWQEHESPYERLAEGLVDRGLAASTLALGPTMRAFVAHGIGTTTSATLAPVSDAVSQCRVQKSDAELARMRRANEATKASLAAAAKRTEVGMSEADVEALVREAQSAAGLEQIWALVAFGEAAAYPHGTREKHPLRAGELVLVDTGGKLHGYSSDITRTWPTGPVTSKQAKAWNAVLAAQSAGLEGYRAGATPSEADQRAREAVTAAGFGPEYTTFTHRLGHGIGMEVHEHPYVVRGNTRPFARGNTMSNEPGIYIPGSLGIRIEDIVAITADGPEVFGPRAASIDDPFGEG
ncbi:MAG: Xaa-Pro peptidase family protein [Myxococcota bacterium]